MLRQIGSLSFFSYLLICTMIFPLSSYSKEHKQSSSEIKLILQITVDGLRADLLNRYYDRFGEGGFNYLMNSGVMYTNANYQHANTETIVGHTTLATGTFPSEHGMIGNVWFDRENGELSYNIEDANYSILPVRDTTSGAEQVDPAQLLSRTQGRSPEAILAPTIGDSLSVYNAGKSKIFAVSGKDRSAVSMAGKTGKAFWFSTDNGKFVTSTYYYDTFPNWAQNWNKKGKAKKYANTTWELLGNISTYLQSERDDRAYEVDLKGFGRVFPHKFSGEGNKLLYTQVLASPVGDKLIVDFTKELIKNEDLGKGPVPDYLSISFSGVDAVNHFFGPSSLENEDVVRQIDRTIADLLKFIDKQIGLDHTLIILSADHGMSEMPEYMTELGYSAGRVEPKEIIAIANEIGKKYGIDEVVRFFYRPYLYLNYDNINAANINHKDIEKAIANAITDTKGIELATPSRDIEDSESNPTLRQIQRNNHPSRSGDIYVVQKPYWFLFDEGKIAAMHGSPWRYDTHVPVMFVGPGIKPQRIQRLIHPVDVAPTIATYIGFSPPASTQGTVLEEVFE